jgi:hypothetical protein
MNTILRSATLAELQLLLKIIERQGSAWTRELPPAAKKDLFVGVNLDPNFWDVLVLKYRDESVDTVADLAQLKMIVKRLISRLAVDRDQPPNLKLAKNRSSLDWKETNLEK